LAKYEYPGIPLGKALGKHPPLKAALEKIQDRVEDLATRLSGKSYALISQRIKTSALWVFFACRDLKCVPASCPTAQDEGMNEGKSIFSQLIKFLPDREFSRCVARYDGDQYTKKLYCFGSSVERSTLADANENRDWRIFADFAQVLIRTAITLYANDATGIADVRDLYALDSTTIDLCLALFPWARFRKHKVFVAGVVQNAHPARSAWLDPHLHSHHQRQGGRRQRAR
jgi:hypothetical protein